MSTIRAKGFTPILAIVAFAGSAEAAHQSAFDSLESALVNLLKHGNSRPLDDTLSALGELKGARVARIVAAVTTAYGAARASWEQLKRTQPDTAEARAQTIRAETVAAFDAAEQAAADASKAKREAKAAERAKAERTAKREAAQAEAEAKAQAAIAKPLTVADALAFLRAAIVAGDDSAFEGLAALADEFCEVQVDGRPLAEVVTSPASAPVATH